MTTEFRPLPSPRTLAIVLVLALAVGIGLGVVARGDNVLALDLDVTTSIQQLQGDGARALADLGNALGSTPYAAVAIALCLIGAAVLRAWPELAFFTALMVLRVLGTQLKPIFSSPRPTDDIVEIVGTWEGTGYPSGHALTASTMTLGLAVIAWRRIPSRGAAVFAIGLLILVALVIGWARVWTGAHWASDVLGGYAFGVAIVAAASFIFHRLGRSDT